MGRISTQHLVLVTGLGLVVSAAPQARPAPVARIATHHSASRRTRAVSFAALFGTETTFKAKATTQLRFRPREATSGDPVCDLVISSFRPRGADGASTRRPAAEVPKGVFS